jgi:hypothetical protein
MVDSVVSAAGLWQNFAQFYGQRRPVDSNEINGAIFSTGLPGRRFECELCNWFWF